MLEPALPESDLLANLDDSSLTLSPDSLAESDSGNEPADDPLEGPIQPTIGNAPEVGEPLRRPWDIQFRARVSANYDDNIFIQNRNQEADVLFHLAPGFTYVRGDTALKDSFLSLSYDADAILFLDHSYLDSVDHNALLRAQWHPGRVTLGGFFQFQDLTGSDNDVGARVNRRVYVGGLSVIWPWSVMTALEIDLEARQSDYVTQLDSTEALVRSWMTYQYSPVTAVSVGLTAGALEVSGSGRQNYVQALGRVNYEVASKTSIQMRAGVELRDREDSRSTVTPVFNVGAVYTPYPLLDVRFDAYRLVQPSISAAGVNTVVTGVGAGVNYRFLRYFGARLGGGFEHSEYDQPSGASGAGRNDDYFFVRSGLQYLLNDHCTIGAFYEFRRNASSQSDRSFQNNQVGFEMSVAF